MRSLAMLQKSPCAVFGVDRQKNQVNLFTFTSEQRENHGSSAIQRCTY